MTSALVLWKSFWKWLERAYIVQAMSVSAPTAIAAVIAATSGLHITLIMLFIVTVAFITLLFWVAFNVFPRYGRIKKAVKNLFFISRAANELGEYIRATPPPLLGSEDEFERHSEIIATQFIDVLNQTSQFFDCYTKDDCHVSIKVFIRSEDANKSDNLKTYARDDRHRKFQRWQTDEYVQEFSYKDNTGFKHIIEDHMKWFVCNSLKKFLGYKNRNNEWSKYYNACLIVPITPEHDANKLSKKTIEGFLCVDNMKGNLDSKFAIHNARLFAQILYPSIMRTRGESLFPGKKR